MPVRPEPDPAARWTAPGQPGLVWLGQAGFWIETGAHRILIDPYLSDSLARKYAGQRNDHRRMMAPPVLPEDLPTPDLVLVTHAHTDHMDPDTLAPLARRFPGLPFVVPQARITAAQERIGPAARLVPVDAGQRFAPLPGLSVTVLPAAHESFDRDAAGHHPYLGYGVATDQLSLYHSGDCIPFPGLEAAVRSLAADLALLPVNGRDATRLAAGIPGNFTLGEAAALAHAADVPFLIPHHFGMFAFNTIDGAAIDSAAAHARAPRLIRPTPGGVIWLRKAGEDGPDTHDRG
jgi:L-ascorbate metabolism protein UlaG (beta-lactamase superfamily)